MTILLVNKDGDVCGRCGSKINMNVEFVERYYPKGLSCYTFIHPERKTVLKAFTCAKCLNSALNEKGITELGVFVDKYVFPITLFSNT